MNDHYRTVADDMETIRPDMTKSVCCCDCNCAPECPCVCPCDCSKCIIADIDKEWKTIP